MNLRLLLSGPPDTGSLEFIHDVAVVDDAFRFRYVLEQMGRQCGNAVGTDANPYVTAVVLSRRSPDGVSTRKRRDWDLRDRWRCDGRGWGGMKRHKAQRQP